MVGIIALIILFFAWPAKNEDDIQYVTYEEASEKITRYEFAALLCERYGLVDYSLKYPIRIGLMAIYCYQADFLFNKGIML